MRDLSYLRLGDNLVNDMLLQCNDINTCNDSILVTDFDTGEIICQRCAKVLQERMPYMRKESVFLEKESSHGDNTSIAIHDRGLSTVIGKSNTDFIGRKLDWQTRQTMNRMRLWDSRSKIRHSSEKNLRHGLFELDKIKEKLGLSDTIIERAAYIYRKATKEHLSRGRTVSSTLGACLYAACKEMGTERKIKDIASELQEKPKLISKSYRILFNNLRLGNYLPNITGTIIKIANNLSLPEVTKREAVRFYCILQEKELTVGKNPHAVAAAVVYMAAIKTRVNLTQSEVTKIAGITSVTIRNRVQEYRKHIDLV